MGHYDKHLQCQVLLWTSLVKLLANLWFLFASFFFSIAVFDWYCSYYFMIKLDPSIYRAITMLHVFTQWNSEDETLESRTLYLFVDVFRGLPPVVIGWVLYWIAFFAFANIFGLKKFKVQAFRYRVCFRSPCRDISLGDDLVLFSFGWNLKVWVNYISKLKTLWVLKLNILWW